MTSLYAEEEVLRTRLHIRLASQCFSPWCGYLKNVIAPQDDGLQMKTWKPSRFLNSTLLGGHLKYFTVEDDCMSHLADG
jgi:hypothetical protein